MEIVRATIEKSKSILPEGIRFYEFDNRRIFEGRDKDHNLRSTLIFILMKGPSPKTGDFGGPGLHKEDDTTWYVTEINLRDLPTAYRELVDFFNLKIIEAIGAIRNA